MARIQTFRMEGEQAEIWASGQKAGILRRWTLTAYRPDTFDLTALSSTLPLPKLPPHLLPYYELRLSINGTLWLAKVQVMTPTYLIGKERLTTRRIV